MYRANSNISAPFTRYQLTILSLRSTHKTSLSTLVRKATQKQNHKHGHVKAKC